jgi:hypothetical protein
VVVFLIIMINVILPLRITATGRPEAAFGSTAAQSEPGRDRLAAR